MAVGATQKMVQTKQMEFATAMLKRLQEEKGSKLIEFSEKAQISGSNQYTFYRVGESAVGTGEFNMYADNYAGTGGEGKKFVATIEYVYAHEKIKRSDLNSTSLDLKGTFVSSLVDALKRNVDKTILDTIKTKGFDATITTADKCVLVGDVTKDLIDPANVDTIIETSRLLATLAKDTSVTSGMDVCIVMDAEEYAKLHTCEKFTKNDWFLSTKLATDNTLFGCEVVKVARSVKDKGLIMIAKGAFGVASWENDVEADSEWMFGQDCLAVRCSRSLGVVVLDEKAIYKVQYKV